MPCQIICVSFHIQTSNKMLTGFPELLNNDLCYINNLLLTDSKANAQLHI